MYITHTHTHLYIIIYSTHYPGKFYIAHYVPKRHFKPGRQNILQHSCLIVWVIHVCGLFLTPWQTHPSMGFNTSTVVVMLMDSLCVCVQNVLKVMNKNFDEINKPRDQSITFWWRSNDPSPSN